MKEAALDHTVWQSGFGRGCGLVIRQTMERVNKHLSVYKPELYIIILLSFFLIQQKFLTYKVFTVIKMRTACFCHQEYILYFSVLSSCPVTHSTQLQFAVLY